MKVLFSTFFKVGKIEGFLKMDFVTLNYLLKKSFKSFINIYFD